MVKINSLEIENVKRVKAVSLSPAENGLTVIGGNNGQGKTSVLDAIAWGLGGDRFKPSSPARDGSVVPPFLHIELSNGLIVERKGDSSYLKVIDPSGNKAGQQLLNEFIEGLALNLPKFMQANPKEKADTLLKIIGVGDKLVKLEAEEQRLYNSRHTIGIVADQKSKFAKEMPVYTGVPSEPISASDLIRQQQEILARNGENERLRQNKTKIQSECNDLSGKVESLKAELERYTELLLTKSKEFEIASKSAENLIDESTSELEESIKSIEQINAQIRANCEKAKAEIDADDFKRQYDALTEKIEAVRAQKKSLLDNADLPLEGLSVENGELLYDGYRWDGMSGAEQLKVATSIVRKINPECGFVLLDKLEQMDNPTLFEFGAWLESEGLQVIATRVGTGDECSIIIEDGLVKPKTEQKAWKAGTF